MGQILIFNNFGFPMMGKSILLCKSSRIHLYILHAVHMHLHVYKKTLYSGLTSQYIALAFVSTCLEQYWNGKSAGGSTHAGMGSRRGREYTVYRQFERYRYKFEKKGPARQQGGGTAIRLYQRDGGNLSFQTKSCLFIWPQMTEWCHFRLPRMTESCHFRWTKMTESCHFR